MTFTRLRLPALALALALCAASRAGAQTAPPSAPPDTTGRPVAIPAVGDSALPAGARPDSAVVKTGGNNGGDTVVTYSARDSVIMDVKSKKVRLYGDAVVTQGSQKLTAYYIEVDFTTSELYAEALYDSTTKSYVGVPVFKDSEREFSANTLSYNFRTKRGTLAAAETKFDEGFYYGEKIKRVDETTLFVQNGRYTTCDAPHPHYYFAAPEMKVAVGDKIFADQPTLYVADVPILPIPFGIFFPNQRGKQSGILIPQWSQSTQRGFTLERLGFFWAGNDYIDDRIEADLYSKGGYTFRNYFRFRLRGVIETSDLNLTWGRTRNDPDQPLTSNFILNYTHAQPIGRRSRLGGTLNFATANAPRQTTPRAGDVSTLQDIATRQMNSNFSYSTSWPWGGSLSAQYSRDQDVVTTAYTQSLSVPFSLPTWTPFADQTGEGGLLDRLSFGGNVEGRAQDLKQDTLPGGGFRTVDTRYAFNFNPTISFQPKLGYFNVTPSLNYRATLFTRRSVRQREGDTVVTRYISGLYWAQTYGASLTTSTTLYGMVQPRILGLNAIRHTVIPSISFNYQPDFTEGHGYYDRVFNPRTNTIERYYVFEGDLGVGNTVPTGLQESISMSLQNTFEAKVAQGDTLPDKKVQFLLVNLNTSYNAAATDYKWSNLSLNASSELGQLGNLSLSWILDPYADSAGIRIPRLLNDLGQGLLRTSSASLSFSLGFSDQGFGLTPTTISPSDSVASRRARFDFEERPFESEEFFGDWFQGNGSFKIPWQVNLTGSYQIFRSFGAPSGFDKSVNLQTNFSLSLTPTTRISSSASYDFVAGKFLVPSISFYKDLHCWEMQFDWTPSGYATGFYFRLGLKASALRDIKLEQRGYFTQ